MNYEFLSVDVADGGDAEKFAAAVKEGTITVNGGTINLFPAAVQKLPNGRYTVNLRVYNEGYTQAPWPLHLHLSKTLPNIRSL